MTLYFTPNLRQFDAGLLIVGDVNINIPPGISSHKEESECPAACTNYFVNGTLNIFAAMNHMHLLGTFII